EKIARETTDANYATVLERLDEESNARKKLEEEVATMQRESSSRGSSSQVLKERGVDDRGVDDIVINNVDLSQP
ncbi:hypothetical protein IFM89_010792, partial [Coptis chinensis]